jgi:glycosyltransferase involved in cell wall biosynthesis
MIVKNEEDVLGRCLDSIRSGVDEIIIVDTGSTDRTKGIALAYTDKVYDFEWIRDFSAARNESFSKATMDYQMWLDADDVVPEQSLKAIKELKMTGDTGTDIFTMRYITHFDAFGKPVLTSTRERLIKREKGYKWLDPVHECIPLVGNIKYTEIEIHHLKLKGNDNPNRNIEIYDALESSGAAMTPRQIYYYARELKDHAQWAKSAYYFEKFLDTGLGWVEDNIGSCFSLAVCYNTLGETHKVLPVLFKSFNYDAPRPDICSEVGYHYKRLKNYATAFKWFSLAANLPGDGSAGFILKDYYGFIPNIEACVCLSEMGNYAAAYEYNERAAAFKPESPAITNNREYLGRMLGK